MKGEASTTRVPSPVERRVSRPRLRQQKHRFEPIWYITAMTCPERDYVIKITRETSGQVRCYGVRDALGQKIGEGPDLDHCRHLITEHSMKLANTASPT